MAPTRRNILGLGLGGAALLAAGGLGLGLWPGQVGPVPDGLKVLDARSWTILSSVAEALCDGGTGQPSAATLGVATALDGTLATLHPGDAADLVQALLLLENALPGALLDGRPRPFTRCDLATRVATLEGWRTSRIPMRRTAFKALRGLVLAAYWGSPRLYAVEGYPGPPDFGQAQAPPDDLVALAEEGRRRMAESSEPAPTGQEAP